MTPQEFPVLVQMWKRQLQLPELQMHWKAQRDKTNDLCDVQDLPNKRFYPPSVLLLLLFRSGVCIA